MNGTWHVHYEIIITNNALTRIFQIEDCHSDLDRNTIDVIYSRIRCFQFVFSGGGL